ncbi:hypothetical protein Cni_G20335 [Canna indica]|uniref:Uncharacterized protein n=1 Tax=Canna indica TaxID=4628 RepID=A0AAQ3QG39_9LILI|nr:hypothetical protein Cni_G20335 [Canna indica]
MRSHSSSKQFNGSMELGKPKVHQEEAHLSGAYIRTLVKQLSSSRSKDPTSPSPAKMAIEDGNLFHGTHQPQQQEQQQLKLPSGSPKLRPPKKQVRRRLHTTRPYQERLFNMAEARREIVAALKLHRAAMKQANHQEEQQQQQRQIITPTSTLLELMDSKGSSLNHLPNYTYANYFHGTPSSPITFPSPFSWTCSSIAPFPIFDHLNFPLPEHPLGLNLNLQSFQNIDTSIYSSPQNQTLVELPSPPASSSSCSNSSPKTISGIGVSAQHASPVPLHMAMDDEEMAEMQSIGEQHDMEWNDKMNLATSTWWSKFLKSMEGGLEESYGGVEGDRLHAFDEFLDLPYWLSDGVRGDANGSSLLQQHLDEYFHVEDYLQDAALDGFG